MKNVYKICSLILLAALSAGCQKDKLPAEPDWDSIPDPSQEVTDDLMKPAPCTNKVVAHRGGSAECGEPDNSIASLKYSMSIKAYAAECDVYYTSDDDVIVAHADGDFKVNGLKPYEHTVKEIRAAGKLPNGEQIPTLREFIQTVMVEGNCTKLMIDIKKLDSAHLDFVAKCAKKTCDIIDEMGAKYFVDLLCTGTNENTMKIAWGYAQKLGVEIGMNSGKSPSQYNSLGFNWANFSAVSTMGPQAGGTGTVDPLAYLNAGVSVSVYSVDKQRFNGDSVYSDAALKYYADNISLFKVITSNYPAWLIAKLENATKTYDGISSLEEFKLFAAELQSDPTAKRFQDKDGEVVLKSDLTINDFTPLFNFKGVLNGNGKTLTLKYSGTDTKVGLFKSLGGTVKNLTVDGSFTVTGGEGEAHIGVFAADASSVTLSGCVSKASITVDEGPGAASRCFVIGGLIGKVSGGSIVTDCVCEGSVSFNSPGFYLAGGVVGGCPADEGITSITGTKVSSNITMNGSNASDWHYVGGLTGKMQSTLLSGTRYGLVISGSEFSGKIKVGGTPKVRIGGIAAYAKVCNNISECKFSGTIEIGACALERNVGGICGYQESPCEGLIKDCVFSGRIDCASGATKAYWIGGIISSGYTAASVIDGCRTTKTAYVKNLSLGSVGMIAARPNTAITIKNCNIAGTIVKGPDTITLSSSNIEDWMFKGSATEDSRGVIITNCGFNAE